MIANPPLIKVVENATTKLVVNFQNNAERFWNERDIHWRLFHYIKQQQIVNEVYPTELIRAEFPTLQAFPGDKPARGHYDLVIINKECYQNSAIQNMKAQAPWDEYLELIELDVAIEVKIWQARLNDADAHELIDWDIRKLTEKPHKVRNAYFLNFVQLDFQREHNRSYYQQLREYLTTKMQPGLNILCVPSDRKVQPSHKDDWL